MSRVPTVISLSVPARPENTDRSRSLLTRCRGRVVTVAGQHLVICGQLLGGPPWFPRYDADVGTGGYGGLLEPPDCGWAGHTAARCRSPATACRSQSAPLMMCVDVGLIREARAVAVRRVLYGATFGALGATLGWFTWVAVAILLARPHDVWISALVGGLLGAAFEGVRLYRATARSDSADMASAVGGGRIPFVALLSSIAGVFLAVAGENSLGELVKEVRLPFLLSLITFYVGGATVAAVVASTDYSETRAWSHMFEDSEPFEPMTWLLIVSPLVAASLLSAVYALAGTDWSWMALYSWWMIISVFAGLVLAIVRGAPWRGLLAAAAFVVIFVTGTAAAVGPRDDHYDRLYGPYSKEALMSRLHDRVTANVLDAPDVPAEAWNAARRRLQQGRSVVLLEPQVPLTVSRGLTQLTACDRLPAGPNTDYPAAHLEQIRDVCRQIAAGVGSGWTRSGLVILFFCIGLAAASRLERRWRPSGYLDHPIRRYDHLALRVAAVSLLLGALIVRLTGAG